MIVQFPAPDPQLRSIGEQLRSAREARGLAVDALASAMHIAPDRLRRGEAGATRLTGPELHAAILELHIPLDLLFRTPVRRTAGTA